MSLTSLYDAASLWMTPSGRKEGKVYSEKPVPVYGAELVTNGDFVTDSDWTKGSAWSISGGTANCDGTQSVSTIIQNTTNSSGKYFIQFELKEYTQGIVGMSISGTGGQDITVSDGVLGVYNTIITTTSNNFSIEIKGDSNFIGSVDNVSVKEVLVADGDFTFTRGSNLSATRVNASQLIEKGRENLLLQSNNFNTTWTLISASVTSGQNGYDGSSDAWLLTKSGTQGRVQQTISASGVQSFSVYAKKNASDFLRVFVNGPNSSIYFDLTDGSIQSSSSIIKAKTTNLGGGWYRCEVSFNGSTTKINVYPSESGSTAGTTGSIYIQDAQLEIGLAATEVIESGATTGKAGILEDTPRFDYSGGATCPSLLLEPSRSNLFEQSEYFGAWINTENTTLVANAATSPQGVENAYSITAGTNNNYHRIFDSITTTSGTNYTVSIFAKANGHNFILFRLSTIGGGNKNVSFNLSTAAVDFESSAVNDANVEPYGNGWYRCSITFTADVGSMSIYIRSQPTTQVGVNDGINQYVGNGTDGIQIYGAETEAGSYATSYIPTYSVSATRAVDVCSKTNASDVIGQTEGTLFVEANLTDVADSSTTRGIAELNDGGTFNRISLFRNLNGTIRLFVRVGGTAQMDQTFATPPSGNTKIGIGYATNDIVLYVNGTQVASDNSASIPACTDFDLGQIEGNLTKALGDGINQSLLFKTRLTNSELATLTTI